VTARRAAIVLAAALAAAACGQEEKGPAPPPPAVRDPHAGMASPPAAAPTKPPVTWAVPQGWKQGHPSSSMRLAQFDVGTDADGQPVQCIVFGGEMGDDEQNVTRWVGQMGPDAKAGATVTKSEQGALKITRVVAQGPYTDAMRPGDAKTIADAALLAAIITSPGGKLYVKLVGPKAQVDAAAKQFDEFIASMK
jgi:hypothetical protein